MKDKKSNAFVVRYKGAFKKVMPLPTFGDDVWSIVDGQRTLLGTVRYQDDSMTLTHTMPVDWGSEVVFQPL